MTAAHSPLGASSMHRWSACPGSVRLSADLPPTTNKHAEEGTDAHAYAAWCLNIGQRPYETHKSQRMIDGRLFDVTDEMIEAVAHHYDYVMDSADDYDTRVMVEQRFDLSAIHPGCFGTADAVIWRPHEKLLIVADYKHGRKRVKVEENPQLQYYALGALLNSKLPAERVRMAIVQPRCGGEPITEWEIDAIDLLDFRRDLKRYAEATEASDAPLVPGDHCYFCPAGETCPALKQKRLENAFTPVDDDLVASLPPFLKR